MLDLSLLARSQTNRTLFTSYPKLGFIRSIEILVPLLTPLLPCCPSLPHVMGRPLRQQSPFCFWNRSIKKESSTSFDTERARVNARLFMSLTLALM